jgi:DNA repair protein RadA/Sms
VFGEVGLAGEIRQVSHAKRRLVEASRLGFRRAIVPANSPSGVDGMQLLRVSTVTEALAAAGLGNP